MGLSAGAFDEGRGEAGDFRAAMNEAASRGGLPIVAGGFSFGAAVALQAIREDPRVSAYIGAGLPLATSSGRGLPLPTVPALFLVGSGDTFGPPEMLRRFVGAAGRIVEIPGADHFFDGKLDRVEEEIAGFVAELPVGARAS